MIPLHAHSFYSFSRGTISPERLVALAKRDGMHAVAQTDVNNLSGAIEFYNAARKANIKPIIGVELRTRFESAVLLARNANGYRRICEITTDVLDAIPQTKPKITLDSEAPGTVEIREEECEYHALAPFLQHVTDDVFVLSSTDAILESLAAAGNTRNLFIELTPHGKSNWKSLRKIYERFRLPVVATNDIFFESANNFDQHKLLRAIGTNTTMSTLPAWEVAAPTQHFATERELRALLGNISEEAFANTRRIADACDITLDFARPKFVQYPVDNPVQCLRARAAEGFQRRFPNPKAEHHARFEYELEMIQRLGAVDYYLAVWDMIEFARRKNFPYLGRGSGANSLIAYCLRISNVDPIQNTLRFERFLNPERSMPPDFDIDFSWTDRYEVIHYMIDKYGRDRSAMLCTIQCYRDRGAVREAGKALGFTDAEINEHTARIQSAYVGGNVRADIDASRAADLREWTHYAAQIDGLPRHLSVHVGGLLIADKSITHYTPVQQAPAGVPITQQDMFSADDWKLIKLDILATRGLGTYWDTMRLVEERTGARPPVEDERIAFNDEATKELIRSGKSRGCFYIESPAMIGLLRKLRTDTFENLTAASSVIRPGVAQSGMMQEFIARHRDPARRKKMDPILGRLMPDTYGVMVYQEDVLNVAHEVAGLTYGEADLMRRAMSGKTRSHERVSDLEEKFLRGCAAKGYDEKTAREIWRQVVSFSGYSFCKAHSASYAVLSFQEAWLKVRYPAEFLCSVLNNQGGFYRHQEYLNEARLLGVRVTLPDVNQSNYEHTVDEAGAIRLGFVAFKDLSRASIDALLRGRDAEKYHSVEDFAVRSGVTLEDGAMLVTLGACDAFGLRRVEALVRWRSAKLASSNGLAKKSMTAQASFHFDDDLTNFSLDHLSDYDPLYRFALERETFGYSVTNHPCDFLSKEIPGTVPSDELSKHVGKKINVLGAIAASKTVTTRKGERMLMLNLSDHRGMMDIIVWPEQLRNYYTDISTAGALKISGTVTESFGVAALEAREIQKVAFVAIPKKSEQQLIEVV